jgi:hypothetical protein
LGADIASVNATLAAAGVSDAGFKKTGAVSMPPEVIFYGGAVASIPDNGNFAVLLKTERKVGDKVNVTLQTLQFGDQVYVVGGQETD